MRIISNTIALRMFSQILKTKHNFENQYMQELVHMKAPIDVNEVLDISEMLNQREEVIYSVNIKQTVRLYVSVTAAAPAMNSI